MYVRHTTTVCVLQMHSLNATMCGQRNWCLLVVQSIKATFCFMHGAIHQILTSTLWQCIPMLCSSKIHNVSQRIAAWLMQVLRYRLTTMLQAGRNVVLVGDLNIAPHLLDHCDWCYNVAPNARAQFLQHRPDRQWFQQTLVEGGGPLTDVFRAHHPDRYTPEAAGMNISTCDA